MRTFVGAPAISHLRWVYASVFSHNKFTSFENGNHVILFAFKTQNVLNFSCKCQNLKWFFLSLECATLCTDCILRRPNPFDIEDWIQCGIEVIFGWCVRCIQMPSENTLANGNIFSFAKFRFMSCVGTTATWWWETLKRNDDTCSLHLINITRTACDYSVQMPEWTFCIFYHISLRSNSVVNTADYPHFSLSLSLTLPHPHIRSS